MSMGTSWRIHRHEFADTAWGKHRVGSTTCKRLVLFGTHRVADTSCRGHAVQREGYIVMVVRRVGGISSRGHIVL